MVTKIQFFQTYFIGTLQTEVEVPVVVIVTVVDF
jgi:hypothetical protein